MAAWNVIFRGQWPDVTCPVDGRVFACDWVIERTLRRLMQATGHSYWAAGAIVDHIQVDPPQPKLQEIDVKHGKRKRTARKDQPVFEGFKSDENY